ncbi:hypothetical protein FHW58_002081 [Duganella sp. 1224]|nr:hypothetical protein [Duganella sp. 1224]
MESKPINAGQLRAIGYDPRERLLRAELEDLFQPPADN